ncbi:cysteine hydrolase [Rhizobium sp. XQZ8]|nr:cysteine hydrolase [Rhizobium populisoli]
MQRMFKEDTPWHVPWMAKVSPAIVEIAGRHPEKTIFTRFVPPVSPEQVPGAWRDYYRKWENMTFERLGPEMVDVIPELKRYIPPAKVFDKMTYSPWIDGNLHRKLQTQGVQTLAISGGETDVCVLAAALGAIDLGYEVKLLKDAVCSGADDTYDASLQLLGDRFSVQVEIVETETFIRRYG